ncbi:hypothetical protein Bbelb_098940 [Branchiostoma belcheri]|nr:hypothetical protein Bbelb_098940 [Branchiostoma belcheri]
MSCGGSLTGFAAPNMSGGGWLRGFAAPNMSDGGSLRGFAAPNMSDGGSLRGFAATVKSVPALAGLSVRFRPGTNSGTEEAPHHGVLSLPACRTDGSSTNYGCWCPDYLSGPVISLGTSLLRLCLPACRTDGSSTNYGGWCPGYLSGPVISLGTSLLRLSLPACRTDGSSTNYGGWCPGYLSDLPATKTHHTSNRKLGMSGNDAVIRYTAAGRGGVLHRGGGFLHCGRDRGSFIAAGRGGSFIAAGRGGSYTAAGRGGSYMAAGRTATLRAVPIRLHNRQSPRSSDTSPEPLVSALRVRLA